MCITVTDELVTYANQSVISVIVHIHQCDIFKPVLVLSHAMVSNCVDADHVSCVGAAICPHCAAALAIR